MSKVRIPTSDKEKLEKRDSHKNVKHNPRKKGKKLKAIAEYIKIPFLIIYFAMKSL
jgi:hypothetical protein